MFKKYFKALIYSFSSLLLINLIITLLNYINIININIVNIFNYITPFISFFIGSLFLGSKSNSKGWLEGTKLGLAEFLIILIINILFKKYNIILYLIIFIASFLGGILGINIKASN